MCTAPGRARSSTYVPRPARSLGSSLRATDVPIIEPMERPRSPAPASARVVERYDLRPRVGNPPLALWWHGRVGDRPGRGRREKDSPMNDPDEGVGRDQACRITGV